MPSRALAAGRRHVAALAATLFPCAATGASAQSLAFGAATLATSDGAQVPVDTATLVVPQNRLRAGGGTVTLPVVRFRGTGRRDAAPVVYLSGGSGSGIAAARGPRAAVFLALRELGDVITLDLRGAGRSRPRVACPGDEPIPLAAEMDHDGLVALLRRNASRCADSLRAAGVDPAGFNAREIVEDVEALRLALGAPRVRLVGTSTGSQLALEYVRRHGARVERAVLAGVQAPDQNLHLPADQERVVRALAERLRGADAPDLPALLATTFAALGRAPRVVAVRDGRTGDSVRVRLARPDAQLLVAGTLGDRAAMGMLPAVFGAAAAGDYGPLAALKLEAARGGITSAFEALGDCQTGAPEARRREADRQARTALLGRATLDFPEHCGGWGVPELDASYRAPVRSPVPALLVSGTLDGRTPVANAEAALRGLPNAVHLVVGGASHGDDLFLASPEIARLMLRFLRGDAPAERRMRLDVP